MADVRGPTGDLCAGIPHDFEAENAGNCVAVEWVVVSTPAGVNAADVVFTAPNSVLTSIIVPIEGRYSFAVRCFEPA